MAGPCVVVGATGGIGEALTRKLHAAGQALFLVGRSTDKIGALAGELGAQHVVADVLDADTLSAAIGAAGEEIAGLVYAVGSIDVKPFRNATDEDFLRAFTLNVLGAIRVLRVAEAALKKAKGSVVLFSTVAVNQGFPNHTVIAAAKGALEGVVRSLAAEWAPAVRVNAVAPSLTRTPLAHGLTSNAQLVQGIAALHALGRIGEPDDQASAAAFLLGPESAWITGQVIGVDGGRSTLRTKG